METINHECYVSLEVAKLLKEAGFDWEVNTCRYNSSPDKVSSNGTLTSNFNGYAFQHIAISAPTLEVAQRWLREVKNCQIEIMYMYDKYGINMGKYIGIYTVQDRIHGSLADEESEQPIKLFEVYEKAQEALEQKILTILLEEEQQNEETNLV